MDFKCKREKDSSKTYSKPNSTFIFNHKISDIILQILWTILGWIDAWLQIPHGWTINLYFWQHSCSRNSSLSSQYFTNLSLMTPSGTSEIPSLSVVTLGFLGVPTCVWEFLCSWLSSPFEPTPVLTAFGDYLHRKEVILSGRKDVEWSTIMIDKQCYAKYSDPVQTAENSNNILNNSDIFNVFFKLWW